MHPAVLTSTGSASFHRPADLAPECHSGLRPSKCIASARTRERRSLSSTNVSKSARSVSVSNPSLLRSINSCNLWSALGGSRRLPTDSTHFNGASIVVLTRCSPHQTRFVGPIIHRLFVPYTVSADISLHLTIIAPTTDTESCRCSPAAFQIVWITACFGGYLKPSAVSRSRRVVSFNLPVDPSTSSTRKLRDLRLIPHQRG